ncbi:MAG TPA: DUF2252 domain-containing protein [Polyangiaceae bacterium]|nr:DUF2252 domain-containing protein [Polyangiaceae bacterium]
METGRLARKAVPRRTHLYEPGERTFDPIALIEQQNEGRIPELVPIRHARMAQSAFAFYRGSAAVMAADLAARPHSGIIVQLCGDAHLSNFGAFGSPERTLLLDINDFDETLHGPFEWDVKRLVASAVLAARDRGFGPQMARNAALAAADSYAESMREYAGMRELDIWYSRISANEILSLLPRGRWRRAYRAGVAKAQERDNLRALNRLAEPYDGGLRIKDQLPLIKRVEVPDELRRVKGFLDAYRDTLEESRRNLLDRYSFVSAAYKAVGVGSVGTFCFIGLFLGRDNDDPLFLQVKQANASVLEAYLPPSPYEQHGERVVTGQRLMQAASDVFLGWAKGEGGRHFYVRQLWDWKASIDVARLDPQRLMLFSQFCGRILARAHARTGDAVAIASYIGGSDRFSEVLTRFATAYADQAERDHESFSEAIVAGRLSIA